MALAFLVAVLGFATLGWLLGKLASELMVALVRHVAALVRHPH